MAMTTMTIVARHGDALRLAWGLHPSDSWPPSCRGWPWRGESVSFILPQMQGSFVLIIIFITSTGRLHAEASRGGASGDEHSSPLAAHAALRASLGLPPVQPPAAPLRATSAAEAAWLAHPSMGPLLRQVGCVRLKVRGQSVAVALRCCSLSPASAPSSAGRCCARGGGGRGGGGGPLGCARLCAAHCPSRRCPRAGGRSHGPLRGNVAGRGDL